MKFGSIHVQLTKAMKKLALLLVAVSFVSLAQAALKPGDNLTPYTIHNVSTGKEYCQVCAYGAKPAKLVAFGKLNDAAFWADLEKMQAIAKANPDLGVFAQVIDSKDSDAIKAAAENTASASRSLSPSRRIGTRPTTSRV